MNLERIDLVCIFDFELDLSGSALRKLLAAVPSHLNPAVPCVSTSFGWLFYQLLPVIPLAENSSNEGLPALPGFRRMGLKAPVTADNVPGRPMGAVVSVCADLGIGSFIYWSRADGNQDPLQLKWSLNLSLPSEYQSQIEELASHMTELERLYPFVALMSTSASIQEVVNSNATALGAVFTGGREHQPESILQSYVRANLSERDYECFLARWTDALAIYPRLDEELYESSLWRLVQVYELAILGRRALRTYVNRNNTIAGSYRLWPQFVGIEQRRDRLLQTRSLLMRGLPIQSDESRILIDRVSKVFHLDGLEQDAKQTFEFLEGRFQFAKATFLGALAVLLFLVTNWDKLESLVHFLHRRFGGL